MGMSIYVDAEIARNVYEKNLQTLKKLEAKKETLQKAGIKTVLLDDKIKEVKEELSASAYYAFGEH